MDLIYLSHLLQASHSLPYRYRTDHKIELLAKALPDRKKFLHSPDIEPIEKRKSKLPMPEEGNDYSLSSRSTKRITLYTHFFKKKKDSQGKVISLRHFRRREVKGHLRMHPLPESHLLFALDLNRLLQRIRSNSEARLIYLTVLAPQKLSTVTSVGSSVCIWSLR
ncbi:hypothetical protein M9H77_36284 [Catharanthus roseus]|uniref:Uncharacterized protein n=1 Tax=Catharanthus roseus TaxID=4058 RepID=A0ACB9ZT76_CATRO|nr:hypothetical protein M9H77_36284 [Catharanthus roseus]